MFSTYKKEDVTILLKDITGLVEPIGTKERESYIQKGVHYSEMLPLEYEPSKEYMKIYNQALNLYSNITAKAVCTLAEKIFKDKGEKVVLVSLARSGISIGVLIKRYLEKKYKIKISHYTISIIRGKGIDKNAMKYILERHSPKEIQFVDGWTGKGAIKNELDKSMLDYKEVSSGIAVLSDPAHIAEKYGTQEDFFIASCCLNSTVSGLLSRTFYRTDIIKENDFHGALFYKNLLNNDLTYEFIESIEKFFNYDCYINTDENKIVKNKGIDEVKKICKEFNINDINLVKPSIGETTRVLLRRVPWKILVHSLNDKEHLGHLYQLAKEKGVEVIQYPLKNYKACGLVVSLPDN